MALSTDFGGHKKILDRISRNDDVFGGGIIGIHDDNYADALNALGIDNQSARHLEVYYQWTVWEMPGKRFELRNYARGLPYIWATRGTPLEDWKGTGADALLLDLKPYTCKRPEFGCEASDYNTIFVSWPPEDDTGFTVDKQARKDAPMATGLLDYFPDALFDVARLSKIGNDQHNPGEPLHWARGKSDDHRDTMLRHTAESRKIDVDKVLHATKAAWRALAECQLAIEELRTKGIQYP